MGSHVSVLHVPGHREAIREGLRPPQLAASSDRNKIVDQAFNSLMSGTGAPGSSSGKGRRLRNPDGPSHWYPQWPILSEALAEITPIPIGLLTWGVEQ